MTIENNSRKPFIDKRLLVGLIVFIIFILLSPTPESNPYTGSRFMKDSQRKLQFYGKYRSYYKIPNARSEYFAIIKLDSFDFRGNYIPDMTFPNRHNINNELSVKDSILLKGMPIDVIETLKPGGLVYTTFGDSILHFELKDGSFYLDHLADW